MITDYFTGYEESADISKISPSSLAYPSANVLVTKGKVVTRGGLENDGTVPTANTAIHSEFVWKDAPGGRRPIRIFGTTLQVKFGDVWYTIFSGLDADTTRVFFASWVDSNGALIKKRLFFCDGSKNLYQWNGFIGVVESFTAPNIITVFADKTNLGLMGADSGSVTNQTVSLYDISTGSIAPTEERIYSNDPTLGLDMTFTVNPGFTPEAGDLAISKPIVYANAVSSIFDIDVIFNYKNHIVAASYDSVNLYFSNLATYSLASGLDFTMPAAASRTAVTAILMQLSSNFTAMGSRADILWVSDTDDWYKLTKSVEVNAYGLWVDVEKVETGENKGALPMAIAKHKNDLIYVSQDKTLQHITTLEISGKDDILLISDSVEALFKRLDLTDIRLYYIDRGIYIVLPYESKLLILDTSEQKWFFQPPQDMPINCMSIIEGVRYGHHNGKNETFEMFTGTEDLGAERAAGIIATGYSHAGSANHFKQKNQPLFGLDMRLSRTADVMVERYIEEDASKAKSTMNFKGNELTTFFVEDDTSWATNPWGDRSLGASDMVVNDVRRAFLFDTEPIDAYFEIKVIITITGKASQFHLLGILMDEQESSIEIGQELFYER